MGKIVKLKNANNVYTYPITKTEAVYIEDNKTTLKDYLDATAIIKTVRSTQMVTFNDGANNMPVKGCIVKLEPYQEGSDDPSPTNIRPISGWSGLTVNVAGKNLLNNTATTQTSNGITWTVNNDGTLTANGTATADSQLRIVVEADSIPTDTNLYYSGCPSGGDILSKYNCYFWDLTSNRRATKWDGTSLVETDHGDTANNELRLVSGHRYGFICRVLNGYTVSNIVFKPMIRLASASDSTYAHYDGATYPISWQTEAGTVYSGTLDAINGKLTIDSYYIAPQTSEVKMFSNTPGIFYIDTPNRPLDTYYTDDPIGMYCNRLPAVKRSVLRTQQIYGVSYDTGINRIQLRFGDIMTQQDGQTWIEANPLQIVYKLATPQVIQLSPAGICSLLGNNTFYTNAGNIAVDYIADTKLYIDNKFTELQGLILES